MVLTVCSQKGGEGKTTTADAIGAALYKLGLNVLYIDLDAQGNLSYAAGAQADPDNNAFNLLCGHKVDPVIPEGRETPIIPYSPNMATLEATLTRVGKEYALRDVLAKEELTKEYVVIIDTPPNLGLASINALVASDYVVIPAQADVFSVQGIGAMKDTIDTVKRYCNPDLKVAGIVLTRFNPRTRLSRDLEKTLEEMAALLDTKVFNTRIRECTALKEAHACKDDIFHYSPRSNGATDYKNLCMELWGGTNG